jgi:hypothetical protein
LARQAVKPIDVPPAGYASGLMIPPARLVMFCATTRATGWRQAVGRAYAASDATSPERSARRQRPRPARTSLDTNWPDTCTFALPGSARHDDSGEIATTIPPTIAQPVYAPRRTGWGRMSVGEWRHDALRHRPTTPRRSDVRRSIEDLLLRK